MFIAEFQSEVSHEMEYDGVYQVFFVMFCRLEAVAYLGILFGEGVNKFS